MLKKLSVIALLALIIIPAGVMAAGIQAKGAGSGTMSAGGQQFQQQTDGGQTLLGQNSFCNQNGFEISTDKGNGTLTRERTCDQLRTMTQNQLQSMTGDQLQSQTKDQLQTQTRDQLHSQIRDPLQTMTRNQSRLKDGSCGNCPKLVPTTM